MDQFSQFSKYDFQTKLRTPFTPCPLAYPEYFFATTNYGYAMESHVLMQYDPINDTWNSKSPFPGANRFGGCSFTIGHKAFIACGEDSATYLGTNFFWEYNETTDTWTRRMDVPGGDRIFGTCFTWNGKGVVSFGISNSAGSDLCDIELYDEADSSWTTLTHPLGCREGVIGFANSQKMFLGRGKIRYSMGYWEEIYDFWKYEDLTSRIDAMKEDNKIIISPNPSSGIFRLHFPENIEPERVKLMDILSNVISNESISKDKIDFRFDVSPGL